jgi:tyrosyl-tRNA synthetase
MLTFLPLEQIDAMDQWEGSQLNVAKEILAYELTKLIHSQEEAEKAQSTSRALFAGGIDVNMPTTEIAVGQLENGVIGMVELMVMSKLAASKSEARRLIQQGGVFVDDVKVESADAMITAKQLKNGIKIRKGKKTYHKIYLKQQ